MTVAATAISFANAKKRVDAWKLGTSAGLIEELTQQRLNDLSKLGFKCIEVVLPSASSGSEFEKLNRDARQLKQYTDNASVEIWSVHIPYGDLFDPSSVDISIRQENVNRIDRMLKAVEPLGASKAVLHPSYEPINPGDRKAMLDACKQALPAIVKHAAKKGVQITIECLPRTCLGNTATEILYLTEGMDKIGVCCDVNHLLQETPPHFIRQVGGELITTLHLSDYDAKDEKHWLPGKGGIDWNEVISALVEIGYDGPFMFESQGTDKEKAQVFEQLKADYLRK